MGRLRPGLPLQVPPPLQRVSRPCSSIPPFPPQLPLYADCIRYVMHAFPEEKRERLIRDRALLRYLEVYSNCAPQGDATKIRMHEVAGRVVKQERMAMAAPAAMDSRVSQRREGAWLWERRATGGPDGLEQQLDGGPGLASSTTAHRKSTLPCPCPLLSPPRRAALCPPRWAQMATAAHRRPSRTSQSPSARAPVPPTPPQSTPLRPPPAAPLLLPRLPPPASGPAQWRPRPPRSAPRPPPPPPPAAAPPRAASRWRMSMQRQRQRALPPLRACPLRPSALAACSSRQSGGSARKENGLVRSWRA